MTDHQIQLVVLHGRVQGLLDRGREAVDFVDEQHIPFLQIRQNRSQIPGMAQD